jgi:hypothetical protein
MSWSGTFGTSLAVTFFLTFLFMGGCAVMTGRALADTWRPAWQLVPYVLMLGAADRFLIWSLFGGELLTLSGFAIHAAVLLAMALVSYRITRAARMVSQYPWLFERRGPFNWRRRS